MNKSVKNNLLIIIAVVGVIFFSRMEEGEGPPKLTTGSAHAEPIKTYEFEEMLDKGTPTSALTVEGYYTVIEGYTDTCGICKAMERKFPAFLAAREDVVIRKVHFPESGGSLSTSGTAEDIERMMMKFGSYRFNHVERKGDYYEFSSCGTPHIEVYGPDRQIIAADNCGETNDKSGLEYFNGWLAAEL